MEIQKYKDTNTNTQMQIHKYKYTDTNTSRWLERVAKRGGDIRMMVREYDDGDDADDDDDDG